MSRVYSLTAVFMYIIIGYLTRKLIEIHCIDLARIPVIFWG